MNIILAALTALVMIWIVCYLYTVLLWDHDEFRWPIKALKFATFVWAVLVGLISAVIGGVYLIVWWLS